MSSLPLAPRNRDSDLQTVCDLQQRIIASMLRRNGGSLSFRMAELYPAEQTPIPPHVLFVKDDLYRSVELRLEEPA